MQDHPTARELLAAVDAVGLPELTELYNTDAADRVADAPNTVAIYFDEKGEHLYSVYALEIVESTDPRARELRDLVGLLDRLAVTSRDPGPFPIERLQVVANVQSDPDHPKATVEPWPLSIAAEDMDEIRFALRCAVVEVADDPDAVLRVARAVNA